MPAPPIFDIQNNLDEKFVAFIDVMGFSNLVNKNDISNLELYFETITEVLNQIRADKEVIESFLISDSIILIAPKGLNGLRQLLLAIRRIQSSLLLHKILLRGAVSYGQIYYNNTQNIIVGKGFIRAYQLEQEAVYPRVIIDPSIMKTLETDRGGFLKMFNKDDSINNRDILVHNSTFSKIENDGIFIDYANKIINYSKIDSNLSIVYECIFDNLYSEQKLYSKYIWLRDYFIETLRVAVVMALEDKRYQRELSAWVNKFERL